MSGKSTRLVILAALILAAVHAAALFLIMPHFRAEAGSPVNLQASPDGYDMLAINLLSGNGYRFYPDSASTLMREPGYPFFLAGIFWLFGTGLTAVKLCNMLMAFCAAWLMVPLAGKILRQHNSGDLSSFLPSLLFLAHPATLVAESRAGVEMPVALLLVCFLRVLCVAIESQRVMWFFAGGLVLGATVTFRSTPLLFPIVLFTFLVAKNLSKTSVARVALRIAVLMFATGLVLSPWIVRNLVLTGRVIPTASVMGVSAQAGQYMSEHLFEGRPWWLLDREASRERDRLALQAGYRFKDGPDAYYQVFYQTKDELSFSRDLTSLVAHKYASHPWLFARTFVQNLFNFWFAGKTWQATAAAAMLQLPYLLFGLIGFKSSHRPTLHLPAILALFIGYMMFVHAPILAQARYSVPLIPLVSLLAGAGLLSVSRKVRSEQAADPIASRDHDTASTPSIVPVA